MFVFAEAAISGMRAAQGMLQASAHNVANANTPGYKRLVASTQESPNSAGVELRVTRDESPGTVLPARTSLDDDVYSPPTGVGSAPMFVEGSNVDLATELVNVSQAATYYQAMASVVARGDDMAGTLLDAFA